ncbi:MAG: DUF1232 domain-containing protein [Clostridia bacterium]|nr:DUF1232 domain-containing protein [Clostridia bacterium]
MKKNYNSKYKSFNYFKSIFNFFKRLSVLYKYLLDRNVSIFKKLLVVSALIYVISPLDLIPEVVLGFGIIDDVLLTVYVISSISNELDRYISKEEKGDIKKDMGKTINYVEYEIRDEDHKED